MPKTICTHDGHDLEACQFCSHPQHERRTSSRGHGQPLQFDTPSTLSGETISEKKMTALPLNGRSFTDLLSAQAGVVPTSTARLNAMLIAGAPPRRLPETSIPGNMSVSGQRETANGFVVNNANVEDEPDTRPIIVDWWLGTSTLV